MTHDHCKFDVYQDGVLVAGFNPDEQNVLHLCNDKGTVSPEVLNLLADEIEAHIIGCSIFLPEKFLLPDFPSSRLSD
jgi:hypothetical protein